MRRDFSDLDDLRLVYRENKILSDLFSMGVHSIRQITKSDADAKRMYRFQQNERVSGDDIIANLASNFRKACAGKYVVCIQDTSEVNLSSNRINKDDFIGTTNAKNSQGLGFFLHPSLVLDAENGSPYGYANVKIWNRPLGLKERQPVTREWLRKKGTDSVRLWRNKVDYSTINIDFAPIDSFESFIADEAIPQENE